MFAMCLWKAAQLSYDDAAQKAALEREAVPLGVLRGVRRSPRYQQ